MANRTWPRSVHATFVVRFFAAASVFLFLLLIPPRLAAQVGANPSTVVFSAPDTTQDFTITVSSGTTLGSFSVLTYGAPNLDFTSVPSGTTCPNVTSGTCTIEVLFQPTAANRRQGAVLLKDPSGNLLYLIPLDGAGDAPVAAFGPGIISTIAGGGTGGDGGPATDAQLLGPTRIAFDGFGNYYIADPAANKVRKVTPAGVISTFAGTGASGYSGDGGPATSAQLNGPMAVIVDGAGFVYIADTGNNVVRMVDNFGNISTYAGEYYLTGSTPPPVCAAATNSVGDGCPGNQMVLNTPVDLIFCHAQNLHIADKLNNRVRTIFRATYQTVTQVGDGVAGYNGDGELNTSAELNGPTGLDMDAANYIYVADTGNHIIRKTLLTGTIPNPIATVAGTPGAAGYSGDGGSAISAELNAPEGVKVDAAGNIYIADEASQVIRKVNIATGTISTVVGTGTAGYAGNGGSAAGAQLNAPIGLWSDQTGNGNLYIVDSQNAAVRKVDVSDAPSLTFAATAVGAASAAQDVTVLNLGSAPMSVGQITTAPNYSLGGADTTCNASAGETLNQGASCVLGIEFTPNTSGTLTGSVVVTDNANPSSQTISLTGTGGLPSQTQTTETYTLTAQTPSVSVNPGAGGSATLMLDSSNFTGTVSFVTSVTSTDGTPADVTATASPVTLTSGGTGTSTVTITANASAANHTPTVPWSASSVMGAMIFGFGTFLVGAPFSVQRKRTRALLLAVLAISLAGVLTSCGGVTSTANTANTSSSTAPHTYVVTATPTGTVTPAGSAAVTNPAPASITVTIQ